MSCRRGRRRRRRRRQDQGFALNAGKKTFRDPVVVKRNKVSAIKEVDRSFDPPLADGECTAFLITRN